MLAGWLIVFSVQINNIKVQTSDFVTFAGFNFYFVHLIFFLLSVLQRRDPDVHGTELFIIGGRSLVSSWPAAASSCKWITGLAARKHQS